MSSPTPAANPVTLADALATLQAQLDDPAQPHFESSEQESTVRSVIDELGRLGPAPRDPSPDLTEWYNADEQRDSAGHLTALAQALDSISGNGCDCGEDEPGTCMGHLCETALHEQFDELASLREAIAAANADNARLAAELRDAVKRITLKHAGSCLCVWCEKLTARRVPSEAVKT